MSHETDPRDARIKRTLAQKLKHAEKVAREKRSKSAKNSADSRFAPPRRFLTTPTARSRVKTIGVVLVLTSTPMSPCFPSFFWVGF